MSSAVWFIIAIPTIEREKQLRLELSATSVIEVYNMSDKTSNHFVPFKKLLEDSFEELEINDAVWYLNKSGKGYQVTFPIDLESSDSILEYFASKRIGSSKETYIGIIPFSFFLMDEEFPEVFDDAFEEDEVRDKRQVTTPSGKSFSFRDMQEKFLKSMTARLTVAQVVANVKSGAEFTFDFLLFIIMAAWIAALGLMESSIVNLVASMLVSPLMGPVMAMSFGIMVKNKELRDLGIRNAIFGFTICVMFGYIFGLTTLNWAQEWDPKSVWPNSEVKARGELRSLWIGCLVALPSGAAVAASILSGNQSSLIGVAISASLLPPCVNAGLLWAFATVTGIRSLGEEEILTSRSNGIYFRQKPSLIPPKDYVAVYDQENVVIETLLLGLVSLGLMLVNVFSIIAAGTIVLKIKEVTPLTALSSPLSRFWKEDVKIARDFNQAIEGHASLGENFLREWAQTTGLDKEAILSDTPSARAAQIQTLQDMLKDVENDEVYKAVSRGSISGPSIDRLSSHDRLSSYDPPSYPRRGSTASVRTPKSRRSSPRKTSVFTLNVDNGHTFNADKRRNSALLRRSLIRREHQPYSVWPQARRSDSRFNVTAITDQTRSRRISVRPDSRLPSADETEMTVLGTGL